MICAVCPVKALGEQWQPLRLPRPTRFAYEISTEGRIRNTTTGRILKSSPNVRTGYVQVKIGKGTVYLVHRLVCETFVGPCPRDDLGRPYETDHLDWDKANNGVGNLRWLPKSTNQWRWKFWTDHPTPEDMDLHPSDPDHPGHATWLRTVRANGWAAPDRRTPAQLHRGPAPAVA